MKSLTVWPCEPVARRTKLARPLFGSLVKRQAMLRERYWMFPAEGESAQCSQSIKLVSKNLSAHPQLKWNTRGMSTNWPLLVCGWLHFLSCCEDYHGRGVNKSDFSYSVCIWYLPAYTCERCSRVASRTNVRAQSSEATLSLRITATCYPSRFVGLCMLAGT